VVVDATASRRDHIKRGGPSFINLATTPSNAAHIVLGTGPLGRATAAALQKSGANVALVNRTGKVAHGPLGVPVIAGDLKATPALLAEIPAASVIYFCAQPPYHRWPEEFPALQAAAIDLAVQRQARLIVAENLYGYGLVDRPMTEDMPLRPNTRKGQARASMHQDLLRARDAGTVQIAVARGSDFFGPHVDGSAAGARAFKAIVAGKAVEYFGDLDAPHSYTFVEDFGAALAILGMDLRALGEVWHVPNSPTGSSRAFFEKAFALAGQPAKFRKISHTEMRLLGLFIPPLREMIEMVYEFDRPFIVDDTKFKTTFGDRATPIEPALMRTLRWTRDGGVS
jgi:nucleoside-diphosphate-sugar epimerase